MMIALVGVIVGALGLNDVFESIRRAGLPAAHRPCSASRRISRSGFEVLGTRDGPRHSRPRCRRGGAYLLRDTPEAGVVVVHEGTLEFIEIGAARNLSRTDGRSL